MILQEMIVIYDKIRDVRGLRLGLDPRTTLRQKSGTGLGLDPRTTLRQKVEWGLGRGLDHNATTKKWEVTTKNEV